MAASTTKVTGVQEAIANLKKWQVIKRRAIENVVKEIGFKVEASAKMDGNIPVDSGRLRASISTNWSGSPLSFGKTGAQAGTQDGVGRPSGPKGLTVVVGSNVVYAQIQEWGVWNDARKPGKGESTYVNTRKRGHVPRKRPKEGFLFLTKAYKKHQGEVSKRIAAVLKKDETLI